MRVACLLLGSFAAHAAAIPDVPPNKPVSAQISSIAYRPDGTLLALGTFQSVLLVDPATKATVAELKGSIDQVRGVAFSRDGKLLAAASGLPAQRGEVKIWDVDGRRELLTIKAHSDCVYGVAFSPDGKTLATASYDKMLYLWDVTTGQQIRRFKDHIDAVFAVAFTPDGKLLVSASADRAVKVWNPLTGERLYTMSNASDGLNTLAIDPTGRFVAAAGYDKTIRVWSVNEKEAKLEHSQIAHEDAVLALAFSPDGKKLLSSAADRTVKLFDAVTLSDLPGPGPQPDWGMSVAFSPDGMHYAVGRFDGTLSIY